jgi:hypothetical protein
MELNGAVLYDVSLKDIALIFSARVWDYWLNIRLSTTVLATTVPGTTVLAQVR